MSYVCMHDLPLYLMYYVCMYVMQAVDSFASLDNDVQVFQKIFRNEVRVRVRVRVDRGRVGLSHVSLSSSCSCSSVCLP